MSGKYFYTLAFKEVSNKKNHFRITLREVDSENIDDVVENDSLHRGNNNSIAKCYLGYYYTPYIGFIFAGKVQGDKRDYSSFSDYNLGIQSCLIKSIPDEYKYLLSPKYFLKGAIINCSKEIRKANVKTDYSTNNSAINLVFIQKLKTIFGECIPIVDLKCSTVNDLKESIKTNNFLHDTFTDVNTLILPNTKSGLEDKPISDFETEKYKILRRLYAYYGFTIELHATKKRDKFWITCKFNKNDIAFRGFCMDSEFTVKYPSVDTVCEYALFGHKTYNKPEALKWQDEHEWGHDEYFGYQVPFWQKLKNDVMYHKRMLSKDLNYTYEQYLKDYPSSWLGNDKEAEEAYDKIVYTYERQSVIDHQYAPITECYTLLPEIKEFSSWSEVDMFLKNNGY